MGKRRRLVALAAIAPVALGLVSARADVPVPEPQFAATVIPQPCTADADNPYEVDQLREEGWAAPDYERYPGACQRMKFSFGPIHVKPGQNDVLVEPVTIQKPVQDGYITRFKPDLVRPDGTVPPIEQVHLHHGTWLSVPTYGSGPFFAAGEEKTIANFPRGYGLPIKRTDQWLLLYMVHSAVAQPTEVFITYEIDFVPADKAADAGIRPAYPVWLDVRPSGYPVFNTQRPFGGDDGKCTWPKEQCASFDPFGEPYVGQGEPGNGAGEDWQLPERGESMGLMTNFQGGTLIGIGGHLHPGGLTNDIDAVRDGQVQRIFTSEAKYWDRTDSSQVGGPPTSWDFSMTITGLPRWGVHLEPGDVLRSNATYDTTHQSTYENMGIAVALMAPDLPDGTPTAPGVDPFAAPFDPSPTCTSGGVASGTLCDKGVVSHGHLAENDNFGGPSGGLDAARGSPTSRVDMAAFLYAPGDLSMVSMTGIPTVKLGDTLQFSNEDAFANILHTATSCAYPCTGPTGTAFPLANGRTSLGRDVDFDSAELGWGIPGVSAAKQTNQWDLPVTPDQFQAGDVVTYYCRIHPFMRGAFEVTQ